MTDDELRIKVARIVGYTDMYGNKGKLYGLRFGDTHRTRIPNYPTDMNAARDAFLALRARHKQLYLRYSEGMSDYPDNGLTFPEVSIEDEDVGADENPFVCVCADKHPARLICEAIVEAHEKLRQR